MSETGLEFSRRVPICELPESGREVRFEATEQEREAVARRLGVRAVRSLKAWFAVSPEGWGALARGSFEADVVQQCVVTLEPVAGHVKGDIVQRYSREGGSRQQEDEIAFDALDEEPPEPLVRGAAELGELVVEHLSLALDPYPRSPQAQADLPHEVAEGSHNPFGKLRDLKFSATEG